MSRRSNPAKVCELVARHELGGENGLSTGEVDDDRALLNEADALSFFSLNASGFLKHYGPRTPRARFRTRCGGSGRHGRRELGRIKLSAPIRRMVESAEP